MLKLARFPASVVTTAPFEGDLDRSTSDCSSGREPDASLVFDYGVSRCGPRYRNVTSRTFSWPSICISRRVSPKPKPPCGGAP